MLDSGEIGTSPDVALVDRAGTLFAYTAGARDHGLRFYDLSTPSAPLLRGTVAISGLESVAPAGDVVFALARGAGLYSADVSNIDSPALLGHLVPTGTAEFLNVSVSGNLAVVAAKNSGFDVIDVTDPANMVELAHVMPTVNGDYANLTVNEVILDGSTLYAIADRAGVLVYDLTDPSNPQLVAYDSILDAGPPDPYTKFYDGDLQDGRVYLSHFGLQKPGVVIIDVAAAEPLYLGRAEAYDYSRFAALSGEMMYSCNGEMGIFGFELVNGVLERRGNLVLDEAWGAEAHDTLVYVASTAHGLAVTSWAQPNSPVILGEAHIGPARSVTVRDTIAYVAGYTAGLCTVDVSDPANPVELDCEIVPSIASIRLDESGTLAATADLLIGVDFWDVSDPSNITWVGNYPSVSKAQDVKFFGNIAYVATATDSVHIVDILDPANPVFLGKFGPETALGLEINGSRLMVAGGYHGFFAYDLTDPAMPDPLFHVDTPGQAKAVASEGSYVLVADDSGLILFNLQTTGVNDTPLALGPGLAAWPNPFNPATDLRFTLDSEATVALDVYDVAGRHLRQLAAGSLGAGDHQFRWDGQDDAGHGLPSGVYFARLSGADADGALSATRKLVLIR